MKVLKIDDTVCYEFNNIKEFIQFLNNTPNNFLFKNKPQLASQDIGAEREKFTGTKTFSHAQQLLMNGWEVGASVIKKKLKVNLQLDSKNSYKNVYDVVGYQVSVPRLLQGVPTAMINKRSVAKKNKVITLIKGVSYASDVPASRIIDYSVQFIQAARSLEQQGFKTNLYVAVCLEGRSNKIICKVKIKDAGERFHLSKLAYPLAHPSLLRRQIFRFMEVCPDVTDASMVNHYGYPREYLMNKVIKKNEYFVRSESTHKQIEMILKGAK